MLQKSIFLKELIFKAVKKIRQCQEPSENLKIVTPKYRYENPKPKAFYKSFLEQNFTINKISEFVFFEMGQNF